MFWFLEGCRKLQKVAVTGTSGIFSRCAQKNPRSLCRYLGRGFPFKLYTYPRSKNNSGRAYDTRHHRFCAFLFTATLTVQQQNHCEFISAVIDLVMRAEATNLASTKAVTSINAKVLPERLTLAQRSQRAPVGIERINDTCKSWVTAC